MSEQHFQHLTRLLAHHAKQRPQDIALRHKQLGVWQSWSWQSLLDLSERFTAALHGYGFKKDQSLLIISSPNVDVIAISLAVQALGGQVQLIDDDTEQLSAEQIHHYFQIISPDYVLVEQLQQFAPLQQLRHLPIYIFYIEQNDLQHFEHENIVAVDRLLADARERDQIQFEQLQLEHAQTAFSFERIEHLERLRVYYSHQELIQEAQQLVQTHQLDHAEEAFVARAFSSVGHIRYLWSAWLYAGFTLNIPETLETRDQDRQIIAPTLVLGTKFTYQRVQQRIQQRLPLADSWLFKIYQNALNQSLHQKKLSLLQKTVLALFKQVILEELGFSRLKTALIVGEPPSESSLAFYQALHIRLQHWNNQANWQRSALSISPFNSSDLTVPSISSAP